MDVLSGKLLATAKKVTDSIRSQEEILDKRTRLCDNLRDIQAGTPFFTSSQQTKRLILIIKCDVSPFFSSGFLEVRYFYLPTEEELSHSC